MLGPGRRQKEIQFSVKSVETGEFTLEDAEAWVRMREQANDPRLHDYLTKRILMNGVRVDKVR